jgi:hypothetical protein
MRSRDHEQIHRRDAIGMVANKGLPSLRWRSLRPHHVLRYGRLPDIDSEHEKFAVNPRCTPKRVRNTHVSNELTDLPWCLRSATARARFQAPIGSEAGAVPADHCFRFEDLQSVQHARSQTIQSREHQAVNATELTSTISAHSGAHPDIRSHVMDGTRRRHPYSAKVVNSVQTAS